jgi:hypothetical protein
MKDRAILRLLLSLACLKERSAADALRYLRDAFAAQLKEAHPARGASNSQLHTQPHSRDFASTYITVRDKAGRLLAARGAVQVGVHWLCNFVKRTSSFTTHSNQAYDRQRVLCEDAVRIKSWFKPVE